MRVGFVGLGDQGLPMARRIADSGLPTSVWARRAGVTEQVAGAERAGSMAALGATSDVVGVCVFDADGVEEVLFGPQGLAEGMTRGGIVMVHSTVSPAEIRMLADRAADRGIVMLDAPVSGGAAAAAAGELTVMLAGNAAAIEDVEPVVAAYAGTVARFAEVGDAQLAKLINNSLLAAQVGLVLDARGLAQAQGLDLSELTKVLRSGSARSFALEIAASAGTAIALGKSNFGPTVGKDVGLLAAAVDPARSPLLVAATALIDDMHSTTRAPRGARAREGLTQ